ncbi:hypothetical protein C7999DRAFT_12336 [Corynascus novoguineensis]|uniref:Uncharacterized protein n=1 Tax=Corynascus novoguineensis TaxID=1126955 RepID=A0AAN7CXS0_9PEZI|nr:hypothetical protein C7999DRAFT_12336 [Corynascus novoguineensis]
MVPSPNPELRRQVIAIYKRNNVTDTSSLLELLYLGREYPQGYDFFRTRLHRAFMAKANLTDENEIRECIARADFVRKGSLLILSFPCDKTPTASVHYKGASVSWCPFEVLANFLHLMMHQRSKHCKLGLFSPRIQHSLCCHDKQVGCGHSADPMHPGTTLNDTEPCGSGTTERSTQQDLC